MGLFGVCAEFSGSAAAAYLSTSNRLKQEKAKSNDYCPEDTKLFISESLKNCEPASDPLTRWGRKMTKYHLDRNDCFGALLAIDSSTKKRTICILALKTVAKSICSGYNQDGIRAVTYS